MNVVFLQHQGNSIDPLHQFHYIEHEQNGQIAFLDTLISRNNCSISIDVYHKPTHTNRYLAKTKQKISTVTTLNSYPRKLITSLIVKQERKKVTPSPEELVRTFFETIILNARHNIKVTRFYRTLKASQSHCKGQFQNMTSRSSANL